MQAWIRQVAIRRLLRTEAKITVLEGKAARLLRQAMPLPQVSMRLETMFLLTALRLLTLRSLRSTLLRLLRMSSLPIR
jgi:hypothetical protein